MINRGEAFAKELTCNDAPRDWVRTTLVEGSKNGGIVPLEELLNRGGVGIAREKIADELGKVDVQNTARTVEVDIDEHKVPGKEEAFHRVQPPVGDCQFGTLCCLVASYMERVEQAVPIECSVRNPQVMWSL